MSASAGSAEEIKDTTGVSPWSLIALSFFLESLSRPPHTWFALNSAILVEKRMLSVCVAVSLVLQN